MTRAHVAWLWSMAWLQADRLSRRLGVPLDRAEGETAADATPRALDRLRAHLAETPHAPWDQVALVELDIAVREARGAERLLRAPVEA